MKKLVVMFLLVVMVFSSVVCFADSEIEIILNGNTVNTDVPPVIVQGRTMVPFRAVFEELGIPVMWQAEKSRAYTTQLGATVIITANSNKMLVNGKVTALEVAPFISGGRMLIPARAVCEALNCTVDWDGFMRRVIIKTDGYVETPEQQAQYAEYLIIKKVFELINAERALYGAPALVYDKNVQDVAKNHSEDMAQKSYVDHVSADGFGLRERLNNEAVKYYTADENLASGFTSAEAVFNAWKNSGTHYGRMINPLFKRVGIGYSTGGENGVYWSLVLVG